MLSSYRVLDFTDERGMFCGYILAQLGADVISVEPVGASSPVRMPRNRGVPDTDLWWQAYARGKRSLALEFESDAGREQLLDLVANTDFLIESFADDEARRLHLGHDRYDELSRVNPALIWISISPFGRGGPKADWPATDLTVWASSGAHVLAGDDDRAPVRTSVPQSFLHAGADAAGAALIALQERHKSGRGQQVDISAQQSCAQAALSANLSAPNHSGDPIERTAGGLRATFPIQLTWPCRDGHVAITLLFGPAFSDANRRLLRWLYEHDECSAQDVEVDWGARMAGMIRGEESPEAYFALCKKVERFTTERTGAELFEEGLARGIYIAPTFDIANLLEEPHFKARNFWHVIEPSIPDRVGSVGRSPKPIRMPGAFAKFSRSPMVPPGAATRFDPEASPVTWRPKSHELSAPVDDGPDELPLAGLKVLDFMWVIAGPFFTRVLADYGASVVKVESSNRLEPVRAAPPFKDGVPHVESGVPFANFNSGKLGLTIDPANPVGREVILDLVRWADVVTESFSPKAMKAWGLDYETLRAVNPDLIMLSSCLMGQSGPRSGIPGYGNMAAALTGFYDLTGWPDRTPAGPYLAYTDGVSPRFMLASLLAALEHRRKTGEGQHVDVSQAEAAIHLLAPAIFEYELTDRVWHRMGNRDRELSPHGVYRARGEDRWVAIVCQSDDAWLSLCEVMGFERERADPKLADATGRRAREDELDVSIEAWTSTRDEAEIERILIATGVAAHVVQNSAECVADPQLRARKHFVSVPHPTEGEFVIEGSRFAFSRTPADIRRGPPELGQHNAYVLEELLGYDADRIADVFASLALE